MALTIHILMGLPASGKTSFANSFKSDQRSPVYILSLDEVSVHNREYVINEVISYYRRYYEHIIIDGLILTINDLQRIIEICEPYMNVHDNFVIHYWHEDRTACLNNDTARYKNNERNQKSEITIRKAKFDKIDKNILKNNLNILYNYKLQYHNVHIMDNVDTIINPYRSWRDTNKICSEQWCTGGTWCDYLGNSGTIEADEPIEFVEFDEVLMELCPNISFLQYKKLVNTCITKEIYNETDYYGGSCSYMYWSCDIEKLKETLKEMNII